MTIPEYLYLTCLYPYNLTIISLHIGDTKAVGTLTKSANVSAVIKVYFIIYCARLRDLSISALYQIVILSSLLLKSEKNKPMALLQSQYIAVGRLQ